jgi:hypothetical protein
VSTQDGPSRRRRIAGESKPQAPRPPAPAAKKVVRKPVARPGGPPPVEPRPADEAPPHETGTEETVGDESTADTEVAGRAAAPKVAPRVGRRRPSPDDADGPAADAADDGSSVDRGDDRAPGEDRRGRSRPSPTRLLLVLVTVAAVVFGVFFGYRGVEQWRDTHGIDAAHEKAAEAAASAAETIFSYRYDRLEAYLDDSRDVMTPSFAKDFETISPALQDLAPQRRIQVTATTRDAAALPCGDDCRRASAKVLVFVDQARLADGAETPTVFGNRVEMTMVDRDGRWLVDDIKAL